jgi:hypothetical protein
MACTTFCFVDYFGRGLFCGDWYFLWLLSCAQSIIDAANTGIEVRVNTQFSL